MKSKLFLIGLAIVLGLGSAGAVTSVMAHQAQRSPDMPTWLQVNEDGFGDYQNIQVPSLAVFDDHLYAGVQNWDGMNASAQIWRTSAGESWDMVDDRQVNGAATMVAFDGAIYAGSWDGFIYSSTNGITWTEGIHLVPGEGEGIARLAVFSDTLYASTWMPGTEIWRTIDGANWEIFVEDGLGDQSNGGPIASEVFDGQLYWGVMNGTSGAQVWRTDGITTTAVITGGFGITQNLSVSSLAAFDGYLYAGMLNPLGVQIWRSPDGLDWVQVVDGLGNPPLFELNALEVYNGMLYLVLESDTTGLQVWRTINGLDWMQVGFDGFGDLNNQWSYWDNATTVFKDRLYVGINNFTTGGEVWQMTLEVVTPTLVTIAGPGEGFTGQTYSFTSTVEPISTTLPLTFTWQASGQVPVIHVNGLVDVITYTWEITGSQLISVTASNVVGEVVDSHTITITVITKEYSVFLPSVLKE